MTNKITFTQARLKNIPPPDLGRVDYVDSEQPKLIFRISHTGNRSFMVRKRANGKLRNITIGKFSEWNVKDARIEAQRILLELARNEDPIATKIQ